MKQPWKYVYAVYYKLIEKSQRNESQQKWVHFRSVVPEADIKDRDK